MNGIADWRHLRQLALVLQPRRASPVAGAYWLDDMALIKTGQPGPSIYDRVTPLKKTAWENRARREGSGPTLHPRPAGWLAEAC
jgi:hypothetical protein